MYDPNLRYLHNKEILKRLNIIVESFPDLRFVQILNNVGVNIAEFNQESAQTSELFWNFLEEYGLNPIVKGFGQKSEIALR